MKLFSCRNILAMGALLIATFAAGCIAGPGSWNYPYGGGYQPQPYYSYGGGYQNPTYNQYLQNEQIYCQQYMKNLQTYNRKYPYNRQSPQYPCNQRYPYYRR